MEIKERYLTKNKYSRPEQFLYGVKAVVIHWNEMPKGTSESLYDWFEGLKVGKRDRNGDLIYGSTQFGIGFRGDISQYMPETEVAYHVGAGEYTELARGYFGEQFTSNAPFTPNFLTIGIELGHEDWEGRHSWETIRKAIELSAWLVSKYSLRVSTGLLRHYDVTGKDCPKFFVNDPEYWDYFRRVVDRMAY